MPKRVVIFGLPDSGAELLLKRLQSGDSKDHFEARNSIDAYTSGLIHSSDFAIYCVNLSGQVKQEKLEQSIACLISSCLPRTRPLAIVGMISKEGEANYLKEVHTLIRKIYPEAALIPDHFIQRDQNSSISDLEIIDALRRAIDNPHPLHCPLLHPTSPSRLQKKHWTLLFIFLASLAILTLGTASLLSAGWFIALSQSNAMALTAVGGVTFFTMTTATAYRSPHLTPS